MRQFNLAPVTGSIAVPFNKDAFTHLTNMSKDMADAFVKSQFPEGIFQGGRTPICIFQGGRVNFPGSLPGNGSISAGYAWYNGEFYVIDAQPTIAISVGQTLVWTIETVYDGSFAPVVFSDSITRDFYEIKKLKLVAGITGSGIKDYNDQDEVVYYNFPYQINYQNGAVPGSPSFYVRQNGRFLILIGEINNPGGFTSGTVYFTLTKRNCLAEIINGSIGNSFIKCTAMGTSTGTYAVRGVLQFNAGNIEFTLTSNISHTSLGINTIIELPDGMI